MIKRLNILALLLLVSLSYSYAGQDVVFDKVSIKKTDDQVEFSLELNVTKWSTKYKMTVTPFVYNDKGNRRVNLEPVIVLGKQRSIAEERAGVLDNNAHILKSGKSKTMRYSARVPYEDWMNEVSVGVETQVEGCCDIQEVPKPPLAENKLLYYQVVPAFQTTPYDYELTELEQYTFDNPFLHSMEDYPKRYDILVKDRDKGTSVVIFTVGSHKLDMDFQGNKDVLNAISRAFQLIENDPNAILTHIMIAGYASPEGSLAFNTALAQRRAETVKSYIQGLMDSPNEHLFELYNGREDWDGLREKVEKSYLVEKEEIINIIDSHTMEQEVRKTKLKQLNGGKPYKYMLENFYPDLRSAGYVQVYYEIDRKATIPTAVTDATGRTTWIDPESPENRNITRVNEGIELMQQSDFDGALGRLMQAQDDPKSFNLIGVCLMMKGRYEEAQVWLEKALASGDIFAQENLDQLKMAFRVEK